MRRRPIHFERLEDRALMAALPFGATTNDTGEYMLGDVLVTVVLMESDSTVSPGDNLPTSEGGRDAPAENWATNTIDTIAAVKSRIQEGLQWWEDSLDAMPDVRDGLLNFSFDWTHADNPVRTGYEPIARVSNDYALWMYDFLNVVGFNQSGNPSSDIRAFNNSQREEAGTDWAFTIFVVNNEVDSDKLFRGGGSFSKAFAFSGGRFMVVPSDRPASTYAHEAGHMFWAYDEYLGAGATYQSRRGYYNTQNLNHAGNPDPNFSQANSIMANGAGLDAAYAGNTSSQTSLEMIGWRDTEDDGIFDVLDVPFKLEGTGRYDLASGVYLFNGDTAVRTLPNQNSSGLQNDITINQIREAQVSIDDGPWVAVQTFAARTYETPLALSVPLPGGEHTIKIRTIDTRTGAMSPEFIGTTGEPSSTPPSDGGATGFVYRDDNASGTWDHGEPPLPDWALELVNEFGEPVDFRRWVESSEHPQLTVLNGIHDEATLSAIGGDVTNNQVLAVGTVRAPGAGKVFGVRSRVAQDQVVDTWNSSRQLRVDFNIPVSSVSIRAYAGNASSVGRLEAYSAEGVLLERYTTGNLGGSGFELMSVARAAGDIGYVVAYGHMGTDVVLDLLEWGPFSGATTNTLGLYSIESLPPGTHYIKVNPPPGYVVTNHPDGIASVDLAGGQGASGVNFGVSVFANPWHNITNPLNVNGDAQSEVSPIDALLVINWVNAHPANAQLPTQGTPEVNGWVDVNNDGFCTPLDALMVINHLNRPQGSSFTGTGGTGTSGDDDRAPAASLLASGGATNGGTAEGEQNIAPLLLSTSDTGSLGSTLGEFFDQLAGRLESHLLEHLPEDVAPVVIDHLDSLADSARQAIDRLEDVLDDIAPDVSSEWLDDAFERILRRFPRA
jgi:hypothetical protein